MILKKKIKHFVATKYKSGSTFDLLELQRNVFFNHQHLKSFFNQQHLKSFSPTTFKIVFNQQSFKF